MSPELSIVVPTHRRLDVLPEVLAALGRQRDAPSFEVIVVDDGSGDGTAELLASLSPPFPFRFHVQENKGPAVARNRGVEMASGRLVGFLGDDTVPSPSWAARHVAAHEERPDRRVAVVGYTGWHPRIQRTAFLDWINEYGLQFGYALIDDPEDVPFNFLYTSNLSLPREELVREPFDTGFPYPAWEDIELAYRLTRAGLDLVYEPTALVAHDHPTSYERFVTRQEKAGYSAVVFWRRHPELAGFLGVGPDGPPALPSGRRQWWRERLVRLFEPWPVTMPNVWNEALRYHYIRGLQRGWSDFVANQPSDGGATRTVNEVQRAVASSTASSESRS